MGHCGKLKAKNDHCVSRVVEGRFIFQTSGYGSAEAERLIKLMCRLGGSVWGQPETISWKELSREYR